MTALNFPSSPATNDTYTANGRSWVYNGTSWVSNTIGATTNSQVNSLGVGTAPSGVAGEIRATNNITGYYASDMRLKENITPIANALQKLMQLSGVSFDWKQSYLDAHGGEDDYFLRRHDVGVIAQEVQAVLPEAVAEREDSTLAVRYEKIIALLIEAIKEQQEQIDQLKEAQR